ncbi:MAG TPA: FAD-binding protein [Thermoleophilaceae bacterium]|nr:FAD-binding protein [Thermoleophilaceae bacterium]
MQTTTAPRSLITPDDSRYDEARSAFNLAVDQRPAGVVLAESVKDVVEAVRYATANGLRVAPQTTGHNAGAYATLEDTLLVKTTAMKGVEVDVEARSARALAGSRWMDVAAALDGTGLVALHGSSPDVGVVGYSLGGGVGWLARKHGLQANSVIAVELVNADGELVRADAHENPDLFWALRGGGGNFGVVTAIEFKLYPVEELYAGWLIFPWERSAEVLKTWNALLPTFPDEITSVGRILQLPPLPEIPEPLRGAQIVVIEAAFLGSAEDGAELLRPLRELGPVGDTFGTVPAAALGELHQDPREPVPALSSSALLGDLDDAAIEALVEIAGPGSGSPFLSVELRQLGGALGRPAPGAGALAQLNGSFAMFAVGIPMDPDVAAALHNTGDRLVAALAAHDRGRYLNFTERPTDTRAAFTEAAYARLQEAKAKWDADGVFSANHPITEGTDR